MMTRRDDPEKMVKKRAWLAEVCQEVDVDPGVLNEIEAPLLQLIAQIAHGPSRPGAPLTMYVLGLAVARGADPSDLIARVSTLTERHVDPDE